MSSPFSFPDWMPWWMQLGLLIVGILIFLAFMVMPFSVFGLKGRLEAVEDRLDEIQGEIRALSLRLPEPGRAGIYEERVVERVVERAPEREVAREPVRPAAVRPPIPPAAWAPDEGPRRPIGAAIRQEPGLTRGRSEPRFR